jgi:hypothetical protein
MSKLSIWNRIGGICNIKELVLEVYKYGWCGKAGY